MKERKGLSNDPFNLNSVISLPHIPQNTVLTITQSSSINPGKGTFLREIGPPFFQNPFGFNLPLKKAFNNFNFLNSKTNAGILLISLFEIS